MMVTGIMLRYQELRYSFGFVDGTAVVSDDGGMTFNSGNSVSANSKFNFWGADNNFTSYNIDGQIIDAFIYIGKGVSSYTNPTAPLVGNDGTINHFSGFTDSDAYYISPCVDVTGSSANSLSGFFKEVAGASTGTASTSTHSTLILTQFVDKRLLVIQLGIH